MKGEFERSLNAIQTLKGATVEDVQRFAGEVDQLVDVLAAWATSVDYQEAPIPVWVREAIDRAVDTVAGRP